MKKYKLLKWFPTLPKDWVVGMELKKKEHSQYYSNINKKYPEQFLLDDEVENNPEFFEEIIEKEYEILSFICNKESGIIPKGTIVKKLSSGNFGIGMIRDSEEKLLTLSHWDIHSIRRLSDSEVFSIGDNVDWKSHKNHSTISEIKLFNDISVIVLTLKNGLDQLSSSLQSISKAKPVLFVTEDGKEVCENDNIHWVRTDKMVYLYDTRACLLHQETLLIENNIYKTFSSFEKAQEWIILNKPVLSLKDVASIYPGINKEHNTPSHQAEQLKRTCKIKIMKLNEVLIVPKNIIVSIQAIAIETQNKELMILTEMCRVNPNLPQKVVDDAFKAGWVYQYDGLRESYPNKEEYIKNLEL